MGYVKRKKDTQPIRKPLIVQEAKLELPLHPDIDKALVARRELMHFFKHKINGAYGINVEYGPNSWILVVRGIKADILEWNGFPIVYIKKLKVPGDERTT